MQRRPALYVVLGTACLLTACGGSSKPVTTAGHGQRWTVPPIGGDTLGEISLYFAPRGTKVTTAQAHKRVEAFIRFTREHCPCDFEETATGPRLLRERHPKISHVAP